MTKTRKKTTAKLLAMVVTGTGMFGLGTLTGAHAVGRFDAPRAAVVDMGQVFRDYRKRRDMELELQTAQRGLLHEVEELEKKDRAIGKDLEEVRIWSIEKEKLLERFQLQLEIRERELKLEELAKKRPQYVHALRTDVGRAIQDFAEAEDLDLVVEKKVQWEGKGKPPKLRFEAIVVHFTTPQLEITKDVTLRLNEAWRDGR